MSPPAAPLPLRLEAMLRALCIAGLLGLAVASGGREPLSLQESLVLKSLGLSSRPSPVSPAPVPSVLWRIFRSKANLTPENRRAALCRVEEFGVDGNIIRVFPDQGRFAAKEQLEWPLCMEKHLFFNFTAMDDEEEVTMARLEIKFSRGSYLSQEFYLRIYQILHVGLKGLPPANEAWQLLLEKSFYLQHKPLIFDLTEVAVDWKNPAKNLGLTLQISAVNDDVSSPHRCTGIHSFIYTSLLVVSLHPAQCKVSKRARRSVIHPLVTPSNICKRRRLYIDFRDVGWENWIIAPQGYLANYCNGECPYPLTEILNGTNHAILQTLVHSMEPEDTPQPCCVPVRLSPMSMLYYDNHDNVVLRHYEDMVVDECGCR